MKRVYKEMENYKEDKCVQLIEGMFYPYIYDNTFGDIVWNGVRDRYGSEGIKRISKAYKTLKEAVAAEQSIKEGRGGIVHYKKVISITDILKKGDDSQ